MPDGFKLSKSILKFVKTPTWLKKKKSNKRLMKLYIYIYINKKFYTYTYEKIKGLKK